MPRNAAVFPLSPSEGFEVVSKGARPTETLAEYVRRKRETHEPPLSLKDAERLAARRGFKIDASYISKIENERKKNPGADALVGLPYAIEAPLIELICVAANIPLVAAEAQDEQLLTLFHSLRDDEERDLALKMMRAHARARGVKRAEIKQIAGKHKRFA